MAVCTIPLGCGAPQTTPELELSACGASPPQSELLCGHLAVPENYQMPNGRQIELFVMVAPAIEARKLPPMYMLEGGPGAASSNNGEFIVTAGSSYRRSRDVVMVDLRGAGRSQPLHCPELVASQPQRHLDEMYPKAEVEACLARLREGADLAQYNTENAVEDLERARQALGHELIDIQALSYGTRLALEYVRRHASRVRRLVAIGALPPSHRVPLLHAAGFQRAFDLLIEDCRTDPDCQEAFPNLRATWLTLLDDLDNKPARQVYAAGSEEVELEIDRNALVENLRSSMYTATSARDIPRVIDAAARGDFDPFLELALPAEPENLPFISEGVYLSFTCTEDVARIGGDEIAHYNEGTYLGPYRVVQQQRACSIWPSTELPASFGTPVVSSVPTLLITGDRDPVTPPTNAHEVAETLENSRVLIVRHGGHLPFDGSDPECLDRVILEFFELEDPDRLQTTCVEELEPAPFALP